jgi:tetratricopeptide (TPR) repeat protein
MKAGISGSKAADASTNDEWPRRIAFGCLCLLLVAFFAWNARPGFSQIRDPEAKNSDYNLLVQGFRAGQLNLKKDPSPGLATLADPYDPAVNGPYIGDAGDMSYYRGKLYLYFGVTPAVVLLWPCAALTGHYLTDREAVIIFYTLGLLAAAGLLYAIWRRYFSESSIWVPAGGLLALGLAAGALDLSLWCDVYEVAVSSGFAFTMLSLLAVWQAYHDRKRTALWLSLGSLAYGLAVGSRPSVLFGAIILLLPVAQAWRQACSEAYSEAWAIRRLALLSLAAVGPLGLIGLGLMVYNALRFHNPFEFGWHYQLGGGYNPVTAIQFSLHYFPFNAWFYFLEPMRWAGHFPFLQTVQPPPLPAGYFGVGKSYGGIIPVYFPLAWLALAAPLAWRGRPAAEASVLRWFVVGLFLLFGVCTLTLGFFFSASSRYELDFVPVLMVSAVIGLLGLERTLSGAGFWRRLVRGLWCLFLAGTVFFDVLITLEAHAEADYFAGNWLVRQGRPDESFGLLRSALAFEPGSADFHTGLGTAYYWKKQWDDAIVEFQTAFALETNFDEADEAHNNLGYSLLHRGRVDEAMTQFQYALKAGPDRAEIHNTLGDCLLQTGRGAEAIAQYEKAVELKPDFVAARNNLGFALFEAGRTSEATGQFQKVLELEPTFTEARYNLALSFFQMGRLDEAISQCRRVVEQQPGFVPAYNTLGDALRRKGMAAAAIANYQKAVELQPQFTSAELSLAWMLATWPEPGIRDGARALALAQKACQSSPGQDPQALRVLAAAYAETGRFADALAAAKQALALAETQSNARLSQSLPNEIELYQTGHPCRSTND